MISLQEDPAPQSLPELVREIDRIFAPDGLLSRVRNFSYRQQQHQMASEVARTLAVGGHLAVEAGTGVGKSLAYLIPAVLHAKRQRRKAVVSTHTIALQEQLIHKDIPLIQKVLPVEFDATLMKGRQNYLCGTRLQRAMEQSADLFESAERADLERIREWSLTTTDGSLSDFARQPSPRVWEEVRSEAGICSPKACSGRTDCFYQRQRRRVLAADLVIMNHALFFTLAGGAGSPQPDSEEPARSGGTLFPDDFVIFDEAHTLEKVAAEHIGMDISQFGVRRALTRLYNPRTKKGLLSALNQGQMMGAISSAIDEANEFFDELADRLGLTAGQMQRIHEPELVDAESLFLQLGQLGERLSGVAAGMENDPRREEVLDSAGRLRSIRAGLADFLTLERDDHVYWVEQSGKTAQNCRLRAAPVDLSEVLKEILYRDGTTGIFTSATLSVGRPDLRYFRDRTGGESARAVQIGSPFDYAEQMRVHVVKQMPEPKSPKYIGELAGWVGKFAARTQGNAFVLFTSYLTMRKAAEILREPFADRGWNLLVQGDGIPFLRMVKEFRETPGSIIFGVDAFWAGVDVPGEALRNVMITRLPFATPDHPLTRARLEAIEADGGRAFEQFTLPEAILKFRQGIGRLIRSSSDSGILVILDSRILSKPYGRSFFAALPTCPVEIH